MDTNTVNRLRELHGSGYEIADGEPDITGWTIKDNNNRRIGVVDDLLFDPEQQKVRYIIADLKNNDFDLERRKTLIPIGIAELHENNDDVILQSVLPWHIRALPRYNGRLSDEDEQDIFAIFSGANTTLQNQGKYQPKPANFYEHSNFEYDNIFKRRGKKAGHKPGERRFNLREGYVEPPVRDNDAEYDMKRKELHEREEMAVSNSNRNIDDDIRRGDDTTNDRLLNRIRRMQDELNQIERDLRNAPDRGRI